MVVEQKRLSYIHRLQMETKSNIMMSFPCTPMLRWYLTLQGDNYLKSVERFDHMMLVCRFQASVIKTTERKAAILQVHL